jgi:hypothetical protein
MAGLEVKSENFASAERGALELSLVMSNIYAQHEYHIATQDMFSLVKIGASMSGRSPHMQCIARRQSTRYC